MNHESDLETLSALFDGELRGDAERFAMKRLGHDPAWRETCSRWQLAGDALRGRATASAPRGFAEAVLERIEAEQRPSRPVSVPVPVPGAADARGASTTLQRSARRRWVGGAALAASVAMAALFVSRPFSTGPSSNGTEPSVPSLATAAPTSPTSPERPVSPSPAASLADASAAVVAVAQVPRRVAERRSRGQVQRAQRRIAQRADSLPMIATSSTGAVVVATSGTVTQDALRPFQPPAEAVARPWPRAVLTAYPSGGGLTASFGTSQSGDSPSFYPFEPRLHQPVANPDPQQGRASGTDGQR
ncbi:sigma-E factor negative regulatory protein [Montanilutibacter psychrotolerans]|nr:sigma-E factor negative regulatory protein [Lysobacter psychrotolerans]